MTLKFTPPKEIARYAVYADGFGMKLYNRLGDAKNAFRRRAGFYYGYAKEARRAVYLLENVGNEWFVLHEVSIGDGIPWNQKKTSWGKVSVPMTREQYAEWRIAVERERG